MSLIRLNDGSTEMIFERKDLLKAVETHMGYDAMRLLEDHFDYCDGTIAGLEQEIEKLKDKIEELVNYDVPGTC